MTGSNLKSRNPKVGLQALLVLDGFVRLFIWLNCVMLSVAVFTACDAWPKQPIIGADLHSAWVWGHKLTHLILLFNIFYVVHLVVLRLPIPTTREGRYPTGPGGKLSRQLVYSALIATLTKARYEAPFPGFLVFHLTQLPPLRWLMGPVFGPRSKSCYFADPCILDPSLVSIGRNVIIGFGSTIAAHYQEQDAVTIKRTVIEDDVVIGGHSVMSGAHIKRGAVIGVGSVLLPGSVVGENEYWSGNPARRRRILPPPGQRAAEETAMDALPSTPAPGE